MTRWIFDQTVVKYMHNMQKLYLWTEGDASLTPVFCFGLFLKHRQSFNMLFWFTFKWPYLEV